MGVPKTKWSPEEEEALRKGVKKYGAGKWRFIQKDPVLGKILNQRSNVDLKDKWRNMYPGHSTADPTPDSDDDDRKSGSRSRGKSAGGRAASDSGGSHHRRGAANKDSGKRAVTPGVATKDTPNKDGSASKRRKAPVSEKAGGDVKAGDVKAGAAGDDPFLFLVNGQYRTAEEVTRDAARAVRDAERAAAAAEEAAEEAELCEREAWEAERLANELLEEAERQKLISDAVRREAEAAVKAGGPASQPGAGASTIFAV